MRTIAPRGRESGMTLLELMIAMGVFVILGVALVQMVNRAFDFLTSGGSRGEMSDQLHVFDSQFSEDLRSVFVLRRTDGVEPDVRFLYRTIPWRVEAEDSIGGKAYEIQVPVLSFVRTIMGEELGRLTRMAGSQPGAEKYLDMKDDEYEALSGQLKPLGGLEEVLYAAIPEPGGDGTTLTVVRAIRSPIGGEGSLLRPETFRGPSDVAKINAVEILAGVLHFDVRLAGGSTTTWDENVAAGVVSGGPFRVWDSTRGLLLGGRDGDSFPLAKGIESLTDPRDDVFPRRIRARLVLKPASGAGRFARLTYAMTDRDDAPRVDIDPATIVPGNVGDDDKFLKVGPEWIQFVSRVDKSFSIAARGARGTPRIAHDAGTIVYHGKTWEIQVAIPAFREDLGK